MDKQKKQTMVALKKARSSIENIIKMIENNDYCIDIMQQNLAARGLLRSAHHTLLKNHLKTCFSNAMEAKNPKIKKEMIDEIIKISKISS